MKTLIHGSKKFRSSLLSFLLPHRFYGGQSLSLALSVSLSVFKYVVPIIENPPLAFLAWLRVLISATCHRLEISLRWPVQMCLGKNNITIGSSFIWWRYDAAHRGRLAVHCNCVFV